MSWEVRAGAVGAARWAKWVDVDLASKHLACISDLVSRADNSTLMTPTFEAWALELERTTGRTVEAEMRLYGAVTIDRVWLEDREARQLERVRQLADSALGFAAACDLSCLALGSYAAARLRGDAGPDDVPGLYDETGLWRAEVLSLVRAQLPEVASRADVLLDLWLRVDFTRGGVVAVSSDVIDPDSGVDRAVGITANPHGWDRWDGWYVKAWWPADGAASDRAEVTALAPLGLAWAFWSSVGRSLVSLKINGAMARSQTWVALRNARLSRVLGGTGLPSTVLDSAAALQVSQLEGDLPVSAEVEHLVGSLVALAAALNPVVGAVLGVIVLALEAVARLIPRAVAYAQDVWGRPQPFLERMNLSGSLAPRTAPTHAIPPPVRAVAIDEPNPWTVGLIGEPAPESDPTPESSGSLVKFGAVAFFLRLLLGSSP